MRIRKPETWVRYRPSLCGSCRASCCHGWPVEASVADLVRLGFLTEREASGSLARATERLVRRGVVRAFRPRKLVFELARRPGGDCVFLDGERRCTVYLKRPEICRSFPRIGQKPGHCPYVPK